MASCALYKKDEFACLNCPYDECIKDLDARKAKNKRIAKDEKYVISLMEKKERNKENGARWRAKNPEKAKYSARKSDRKKRANQGIAKRIGYATINGKRTLMFEGAGEYRYFCLQEGEYFEFTVNEMIGKWLHGEENMILKTPKIPKSEYLKEYRKRKKAEAAKRKEEVKREFESYLNEEMKKYPLGFNPYQE